jgi:hypothetical protein
MRNKNEQREFTIVGHTHINDGVSFAKSSDNQYLTFKYDKWTKGKIVALTLSDGLIDAPSVNINIEHQELVSLLQFLLGEQKRTTININHLIDKVVVVTSSPNASHIEIQEQLVDAITKAVKDAEQSI